MNDESVRPSPEAEAFLRAGGWSPNSADMSETVAQLRRDGYEVSPHAEAILSRFDGLSFSGKRRKWRPVHDFEIRPSSWYGEADRFEYIQAITGAPVCPLGDTSGAAMLGVLSDGRVVVELNGHLVSIGNTWREALDSQLFGTGQALLLAEDYEPVVPPTPWPPERASSS